MREKKRVSFLSARILYKMYSYKYYIYIIYRYWYFIIVKNRFQKFISFEMIKAERRTTFDMPKVLSSFQVLLTSNRSHTTRSSI